MVPRVIATLSGAERPAGGGGIVEGRGEAVVVDISRKMVVVVGFVSAELDITTPVESSEDE